MTYGELKDRVLKLVFSYSIAGDEIQLSYNNQADYVKQIPALLNAVQTQVYQIKKIVDSIRLSDLEKEEFGDDMYLYTLPEDCMEVVPGFIVPSGQRFDQHVFHRFSDYKRIGDSQFIAPKWIDNCAIMEYRRRAVPISPNVPDSYVLKNVDEVNELFPWYIAAYLVMYDDAFRYSALKNEYETMLQRLAPNQTYIEENEINDAYYGFNSHWCY